MTIEEIQKEFNDIKQKVIDWSNLLKESQQFLENDSLAIPEDPLHNLEKKLNCLLAEVEQLDGKDKIIIHKDLVEFQSAVEKSHETALMTLEVIKSKQKENSKFVKAVNAYGKNV